MADMNNPKSKVAYLMGSFFLIRRDVFEQIGTCKSVRNGIQQDRMLGICLKRNGYKIRIVKVDEIMTALFTRDPSTLWHNIQRTLAPAAMESKLRIISHMLILFFMAAFPFLLLSYIVITLPIARNSGLLFLNIVSSLLVIIAVAVKGRKKYLLPPKYCILALIGALYLTIAYAYNIIPLILSKKGKPIVWRGRTHEMLIFSNGEKR
jgi:hypothetical protein